MYVLVHKLGDAVVIYMYYMLSNKREGMFDNFIGSTSFNIDK